MRSFRIWLLLVLAPPVSSAKIVSGARGEKTALHNWGESFFALNFVIFFASPPILLLLLSFLFHSC